MPPLLAVPIAGRDTAETRRLMRAAAAVADLVELRLDLMANFDLPRLLEDRPCPVLVTCRPPRQGGGFVGPETVRLDILRQAIDLGADFLDIEWDSFADFTHAGPARRIISRHDFTRMPDLSQQIAEMSATGADVVKVVGLAQRLQDSVTVLELLRAAPQPLIAIAMGPAGVPGRLLALREAGCFLTFAALVAGAGSAPGQIPASLVRQHFSLSRWASSPRVFALLGPDAEHAPEIERGNAWLQQQGVNAVLLPCPPGAEDSPTSAISALSAMQLDGCVVMTPWRKAVAEAMRYNKADPAMAWVHSPDGWQACSPVTARLPDVIEALLANSGAT